MRSDVFIRKKQKFIYDNIPPPYFYCLFDFIGPRLLHIIYIQYSMQCLLRSSSYSHCLFVFFLFFSNHGSRLSAVSAHSLALFSLTLSLFSFLNFSFCTEGLKEAFASPNI
jgi:hypothetical protein